MTNRRNEKKSRARHAPSDPRDSFADGELPRPSRAFWGWVATGLKVVVGVALIVGAVLGISWGVYRYAKTTPRFSVKSIEIEGTKRLSRDDILAASGLSPGENLFSLDVEKAQRTLVQSPWIERARVTRRLPNNIVIEVHEREARAVFVVDGQSFLVDENGVPFKRVGVGDPHDLPYVTGISIDALARDRGLEHERLRDILSMIRSYEHLPVAKNYPPEEVHVKPSGHVTLVVGAKGIALHLGLPPFKQRLLRAERVLSKTLRGGATPSVVFLDNQAHPERVVVRVQ